MIENILQYGQWIVLVLSIYSLYLVSSVKHEKRLTGYIFTGISRFGGALIFLLVDLPAFVIANLIQTYIAFKGYFDNKKVDRKNKYILYFWNDESTAPLKQLSMKG